MRKFILITSIAIASMAAAPPATAKESADQSKAASQAVVASTTAAPAADQKKICKLLPTSGTRFEKKTCLTAADWKKVEAEVNNDEE